MILEKLEMYDTEIHDWDSHRSSVMHQIQTLEWRGKSRRVITLHIAGKYPYFRDEITEILSDKNDTENLRKEVQKYRNRYNLKDPKEKQKFYAALLRKGFSYSDIKNAILLQEE